MGTRLSAEKSFFTYARERYKILLRRRAAEPWPWTTDKILRQYRFCNIFREDDRTTAWVDQHIRKPYAKHPNLWFLLCITRQINFIDTLHDILQRMPYSVFDKKGNYAPLNLERILNERKRQGQQVYTGAYMITNSNQRCSKNFFVTSIVLHNAWENGEAVDASTKQKTLQHTWDTLRRSGMGWAGRGFMAYEVVTDMRHTRYLKNARDTMTWANAGPGAHRGLNRIHNRSLDKCAPDELVCLEMQQLLTTSQCEQNWPADWPAWELREVEHTLCEFDKYERVRLGQGRPRSLYRPSKGEIDAHHCD